MQFGFELCANPVCGSHCEPHLSWKSQRSVSFPVKDLNIRQDDDGGGDDQMTLVHEELQTVMRE